MRAIKVLTADGKSSMVHYQWPLPHRFKNGNWRPGRWVSVKGDLVQCHNGIHAAVPTIQGIRAWWTKSGDQLWVIELDGVMDPLPKDSKLVARRGRLLRPLEHPAFQDQKAFNRMVRGPLPLWSKDFHSLLKEAIASGWSPSVLPRPVVTESELYASMPVAPKVTDDVIQELIAA